ncbi:penicillin-binding protein activator [Psychrosphaera ytuae]|uniref:Penicillin-binding protein activator n=1 Tax=Psychrosphaera ytuae TaxID=2820710 RepID=A0A975DAB0_9GAMM|nr:penicillin-binding protein activator [Psychrosphaera ytuae]QTH63457.1 penicillin-binding protein activator [Psychrosphaera ytuae]
MTRLIVVFIMLFFLISCSSGPSNQPQTIQKDQTDTVRERVDKNSDYYLQQAQLANSNQDRRSLYILAAKQAISEGQSTITITAILNAVDETQYNSVGLDIELAKALLFVGQTERAKNVITRVQQGAPSQRFDQALRILGVQLNAQQGFSLEVVRETFQLQSLYQGRISSSDTRLLYTLLWEHIMSVPVSTLRRFQYDFGEGAQAWVELVAVIKTNLANATALPRELNRWKNLFPNTLDYQLLPQQVQSLLNVEPYAPQRFALLLPLSGKLSKQAMAIRDGFLSAIDFNNSSDVLVLDTVLLNVEEIEQQITENQVDFIVGPLEKETIIEYENSDVLRTLPRLNLNIPEIMPTYAGQEVLPAYYYSLAPEDEIEQAIEYFLELGVDRPAVIYADNTLGRRLYERFNQAWSLATEEPVEAIAFRNRSKLGDAVQDLLDVSASEARIAEMKKLFGNQLETEARSRTDIDAVYVIANSQQTRLIKPFFDVSISAFGKRLPIYASSRSYLVDESVSQKRDLNGLVFTEMPWLVRNSDPQLHDLYDKIGEQQTQLKKLFAFGYDAHKLVFALKQLTILQDQHILGLTGALSVNSNNTIKRRLSWSKYQQGAIVEQSTPQQN